MVEVSRSEGAAGDVTVTVADRHSGAENFQMVRDMLGITIFAIVFFGAVVFGLPLLFAPTVRVLPDFLPVVLAFCGFTGLIIAAAVLGAPFDTGTECVFDVGAKRCVYRRILRLRALDLDLRRRRETFAFAEIAGIGLKERREEDGYVYRPVMKARGQEWTLAAASRAGSYLALDRKLDEVRAATGIAKRDLA
jgi:hypothetical protein